MPEIFSLILKIEKKLDQFQRRVLKDSKLTPPQHAALNVLTENGGSSLSQLADACYSSRSTMTNLVDNLEKKGLVKREPHPSDRRSMLVTLTERGKSLKQSVPELNRIFGDCCSSLEPDELQQLSFLLKKVENSLNFEKCTQ
jgi:DNA-binding MarR family transcriptional regulator